MNSLKKSLRALFLCGGVGKGGGRKLKQGESRGKVRHLFNLWRIEGRLVLL